MKKFINGIGFKISMAMFGLSLMALPSVSKAADFDATDSSGIITTALGNLTPALRTGIIAVLAIILGVWTVFFVIGKMKKHVK
jgi:hypothetical protein